MRIFQGYYNDATRSQVDAAAEPLDIRFNLGHPLYEYNVFKTLFAQGIMDQGRPVGTVSSKFHVKAMLEFPQFVEACKNAFEAGADIAFVNPLIGAEAMYANVWEQGENAGHPNLQEICAALFTPAEAARLALMPKSAFALCNYFVANLRFWQSYFAFCDEILLRIERLKDTHPQIHAVIFASAGYYRDLTADLRPFILERLLSSLLMLHPEIKRSHLNTPPHIYEKKFGADQGKYLYLLSGLKNNAIQRNLPERLAKWDELRRPFVENPAQIWSKDDPP